MKNILLRLMFDGVGLHGTQIQATNDENELKTVEGELKKAILTITHEDVTLHSCSRLDANVSAFEFCVNFILSSEINPEKFKGGLNALLPDSISVFDVLTVDESFNSQFCCKKKTYIYLIYTTKEENPFLKTKALHYDRPLDLKLLNKQCEMFLGQHDFSSFCASGGTTKTNVREIFDCQIKKLSENLFVFSVTGDGFLYNMVRIMVGTLLYINDKKITEDVCDIIKAKDRTRAGITAKPFGLYLKKVYYDEDTLNFDDK